MQHIVAYLTNNTQQTAVYQHVNGGMVGRHTDSMWETRVESQHHVASTAHHVAKWDHGTVGDSIMITSTAKLLHVSNHCQ